MLGVRLDGLVTYQKQLEQDIFACENVAARRIEWEIADAKRLLLASRRIALASAATQGGRLSRPPSTTRNIQTGFPFGGGRREEQGGYMRSDSNVQSHRCAVTRCAVRQMCGHDCIYVWSRGRVISRIIPSPAQASPVSPSSRRHSLLAVSAICRSNCPSSSAPPLARHAISRT